MDPNANLAEQITVARNLVDAPDDVSPAARNLAELVVALDEWIRRGGFLPEAWAANFTDVDVVDERRPTEAQVRIIGERMRDAGAVLAEVELDRRGDTVTAVLSKLRDDGTPGQRSHRHRVCAFLVLEPDGSVVT